MWFGSGSILGWKSQMKKLTSYLFKFPLVLISLLLGNRLAAQSELDNCNITWTTQSKNSGESMPCGGGDIGLNVWVENGELFFYIARSGTFDENNALLKLGRGKCFPTEIGIKRWLRQRQRIKWKIKHRCFYLGRRHSPGDPR
jgi:hypothetical protein